METAYGRSFSLMGRALRQFKGSGEAAVGRSSFLVLRCPAMPGFWAGHCEARLFSHEAPKARTPTRFASFPSAGFRFAQGEAALPLADGRWERGRAVLRFPTVCSIFHDPLLARTIGSMLAASMGRGQSPDALTDFPLGLPQQFDFVCGQPTGYG